jgi:hypothetical protein
MLATTKSNSIAVRPKDIVTVTAMVGFASTITVSRVGLSAETILLNIIT